jgi:thioredoxin 1
MKEVNKDNFEETISKDNLVIVDMWAQWCGPCRMAAPILEDLSNTNENVDFAKCNVDENPEIAQKYGVRGIPTFLFFKEGKLVSSEVGVIPKNRLQEKIDNLVFM